MGLAIEADRRIRRLAITLLCWGSLGRLVQAAEVPCAGCVSWEATVSEAAALAREPPVPGRAVLVRADGSPPAETAPALGRHADAGTAVSLGVSVGTAVDATLAAPAGSVLLNVAALRGTAAERLFVIREAAVGWRAAGRDGLRVGVEGDAQDLSRLLASGLAPYVDFVLSTDRGRVAVPPGVLAWRRGEVRDPTVAGLLDVSRSPGDPVVLVRSAVPAPVADALDALREWLPPGLTPLPGVDIVCGEGRSRCASEVFLHPSTLEAVAWVREPGAPWVLPPGRVVAAQPLGDRGTVLRIADWSSAGEGFSSSLDVRDRVLPTVEEILARHQAAVARQVRVVTRVLSHGTSLLTFRVPGLAAPMTVTAETTLFTSREDVEMEQRDVRLNGTPVVIGRDGVPRLPLVEPERAASAPLALSLDERYRYRLEGLSRVSGHEAYRVSFTPRERGPLLEGQAWITTAEFALARIEATQTRLSGAIVSSRQHDELAPQKGPGGTIWLPRRTDVHQFYEGPGHRTPVHRTLVFDRHEVNAPDHEMRRRQAHAGPAVLLRDTPDGWRYLRRAPVPREAERAGGPDPPTIPASADALRQLAGRATRVWSLALGALFDPNIDGPLPFAGLSLVDFDFLGTGTQMNALLAGPFLQVAWSVPSLFATPWQLQGSAFVSLVAYNDRAFENGIERYERNVRQRPARVTLGVLRPGRLRLRAAYELGLTRYSASDSTAAGFLVPASPAVHALRVGLEAERGPWTSALWGLAARRQDWRAWGNDAREVTPRSFQRFGLEASRSFVVSPTGVLRVEAAYAGGRDLDRFSRFNFDAVDNRLRGYPSAALRYDRGGALRTVATFTPVPRVRASAFVDVARVRDPGYGEESRTYPGLGAALDVPLPFRSVVSLDWGYGVKARARDDGTGAHVFRITAYKLF